MMQDISGRSINDIAKVEKFLEKVREDRLWQYFEVKALIFKESNTKKWIVQFIYIQLLNQSITATPVRYNNLILIHSVYPISELSSSLNMLFDNEFNVPGFPVSSMEEINQKMEYYFCGYIGNYRLVSPADLFRVRNPAHILLKGGKAATMLSNSERSIAQDLQNYDQLYPIIDIVRHSLGLNFWDYSYSAFFVVIAPLGIEKPKISLKDKQMEVKMNCQENVNPANIKIKVIGKVGDRNTGVRLLENNFVRIGKELVYAKSLDLTKEDGAAINLYHKQDQFENHYVKRVKFQ